MRTLRQWHLYLGVLFAPLLIFFSVTGAWQLFNLHKTAKNGSYVAPRELVVLSSIHQDSHLPGTGAKAAPLRYFSLAAAIGLVATTILGIIMAYRFTKNGLVVSGCLVAGVVVPLALLYWPA